MTLQEKLAGLAEISPQTIKGNFTPEDIIFEIQSLMVENEDKINYDNLLTLFPEVDSLISDDKYNIFNERLILKGTFLAYAYDIDMDIINALLCSAPLVLVEIQLTKLLSENELFIYIEARYNEYRKNMEVNLTKVLESIQEIDLETYASQLQEGLKGLQELAK